jgi:hypothetical protein
VAAHMGGGETRGAFRKRWAAWVGQGTAGTGERCRHIRLGVLAHMCGEGKWSGGPGIIRGGSARAAQ